MVGSLLDFIVVATSRFYSYDQRFHRWHGSIIITRTKPWYIPIVWQWSSSPTHSLNPLFSRDITATYITRGDNSSTPISTHYITSIHNRTLIIRLGMPACRAQQPCTRQMGALLSLCQATWPSHKRTRLEDVVQIMLTLQNDNIQW